MNSDLMHEVLSSFTLTVLYGLLNYALFIRPAWRVFRAARPQTRFSYGILDIWAAILGLTPTLALAAYCIPESQAQRPAPFAIFIAPLAACQLSGMMLVHTRGLACRGNASWDKHSALDVLIGALAGILMLAVLPIGIFVVGCAGVILVLCVTQPIASLPLLLALGLFTTLWLLERRKRS